VVILGRRYGTSSPTRIATVKTGAHGTWSRKVKPSIETTYQARFGSALSRSVTVGVKPAVTVSQLDDGTIWTHIAAGRSFLGQSVELQRQDGSVWTTIAKAKLGMHSSAVFAAPISTGTETVRIAMSVNQAGSGFLGATSNPLLFRSSFVTLKPTELKVAYGNRIGLTGRISSKQAGQIVTIEGWKYSASVPAVRTVVITRAGGFWNTSDKPAIRMSYQATWNGNESGKVVVGVQAAITIQQMGNGHVGTHVSAGRSLAGTTIQLQAWRLGAWTTLDQLPLSRAGDAMFPKPIAKGDASLRIALSVNQAGAGYLGSISRTLTYRTNFVSLTASSTKVLFGNWVALSGQISGLKRGETIAIRADSYGTSAPTKIGTVTAGSGGHWSFKVSPTIQTGYVARWGSSYSDKLLIGVKPLATLSMLSDGRISTHIAAGRSFTGRQVQLQKFTAGTGWRTIAQMPLNGNSSVIFPAVSAPGSATLRIAMSVNQAGVGFLGTISRAFRYHGG
jgi:hypothetical protein